MELPENILLYSRDECHVSGVGITSAEKAPFQRSHFHDGRTISCILLKKIDSIR